MITSAEHRRAWAGVANVRRSMVVDPEDGRMPVKDSAVAFRNNRLDQVGDGHLDATVTTSLQSGASRERVPGSIFPGGYSAALRILQSPGHVVHFCTR